MIENEGLTLRTVLVAFVAGVAALALAAFVGLLQLPRHVRSGDHSGDASGARRSRAYPMLLLVQTTLSVVSIAGAGMSGRSLFNLRAQDFACASATSCWSVSSPGRDPLPIRPRIFRGTLERVRSMPGVESATVVQSMPFTGFTVPPIGVPGMAESPSVNGQLPYLIAVMPEFFEILGIEIVQGRGFTPDDERSAPVVIVNQTMARTVWPGESALGKCIGI